MAKRRQPLSSTRARPVDTALSPLLKRERALRKQALERARTAAAREREALERQAAAADILKMIAATPTDVQRVFEAIAKSALRMFGGMDVSVGLRQGDAIHIRAGTLSYLEKSGSRIIPLSRHSYAGRAVLDGAGPRSCSGRRPQPGADPDPAAGRTGRAVR